MKATRLAVLAALVACAFSSVAPAQSLPNLPRSTVATGLNDSTLVLVADSARRTRAARALDFRKMLSLRAFDSLVTSNLRLTGAVNGTPTWASVQTFAATQRVDSATGAARASGLVGSPAITVSSCTGCGGGADPSRLGNGTVAAPSYSFTSATGTGMYVVGNRLSVATAGTASGQFSEAGLMTGNGTAAAPGLAFAGNENLGLYRFGADTLGIATGGVVALKVLGGATPKILGGGTAGNAALNIQSGTGAFGSVNIYAMGASSPVAVIQAQASQVVMNQVPLQMLIGSGAAPSIYGSNANTGVYFRGDGSGTDSVGFASAGVPSLRVTGGATAKLIGGAGNMTILAGTGASRTLTLQGTNGGGAATTGVIIDPANSNVTVNSQLRAAGGNASAPGISFANATGNGLWSSANDSIYFANTGVRSLTVAGGAATSLIGGAGNMQIVAGTGNAREIILRGTDGTGAVGTVAIIDTNLTMQVNNTGSGRVFVSSGSAALPGVAWTTSTTTGLYRYGADTLGISNAGAAQWYFAAASFSPVGDGTDDIGTNSHRVRHIRFSGQVLGGTTNPCGTTFGRIAVFSTENAGGTGMCAKTDTVLLATTTAGVGGAVFFTGAKNVKMVGDSGSMTILGGQGNNRSVTLEGTSSGGTATTSAVFDAIRVSIGPNGTDGSPSLAWSNGQSSGFRLGNNGASNDTLTMVSNAVVFARGYQDTLIFASKAKAPTLTAAAGTPNSVCINATTKEIVENAATSCVVSSRRFKHDIRPLSTAAAVRITRALRPATFAYDAGGRRAFGLIAEEVDSVDSRLASRNGKGVVSSVNYEQIAVLLLAVVKDQQRQLDSIKTALKGITVRRP